MNKVISLLCGIIFGIGLTISSMTNPEKVLGFLNLFGNWDPSLIFVMIGGILISTPFFYYFLLLNSSKTVKKRVKKNHC